MRGASQKKTFSREANDTKIWPGFKSTIGSEKICSYIRVNTFTYEHGWEQKNMFLYANFSFIRVPYIRLYMNPSPGNKHNDFKFGKKNVANISLSYLFSYLFSSIESYLSFEIWKKNSIIFKIIIRSYLGTRKHVFIREFFPSSGSFTSDYIWIVRQET